MRGLKDCAYIVGIVAVLFASGMTHAAGRKEAVNLYVSEKGDWHSDSGYAYKTIAQLKTVKVPPKKVFLENTVVEKEGELSRDGTHSPRFCLRMKEACDAAGIPCEILRGGWDETSRALVDFLIAQPLPQAR